MLSNWLLSVVILLSRIKTSAKLNWSTAEKHLSRRTIYILCKFFYPGLGIRLWWAQNSPG